jgi:hypothetical protein
VLGLIDVAAKRFSAAKRRFLKVLAGDPEDPSALMQLGACQEHEGAVEEAIATYRRIAQRWPRLASAQFRLGDLLRRTGRLDEARICFQQLQDPSNRAPFVRLPVGPIGRIPIPIDRYGQALADAANEIEPAPRIPSYVDAGAASGISFHHAGASLDAEIRKVLAGTPVEREWFAAQENRSKLVGALGAGCGFADYNNDGRLDLFLVNVDGRHALYAQGPQWRFVDVTGAVGIGAEPRLGMACAWGDYDDDGWSDLVIAGFGSCRLYRNRAGSFEDLTIAAGVAAAVPAGAWCSGAAFADIDHDGDLDVHVTCLIDLSRIPDRAEVRFPDDFEGQPNLVLRNNGDGGFTPIAPAAGAGETPRKSRGAWFSDVDGDRTIDLVVYDLAGAASVFLNRMDGTFAPWDGDLPALPAAPPLGESRAFGDLDGDGALDALVNRNGQPASLLRGLPPPGHWLAVQLERYPGAAGNRRGIGARIEIRAGELWTHKELTAGNDRLGCDALKAHFALGSIDRLDAVRVTFPSGAPTSVRDVTANQVLTVAEPDLERGSCPHLFAWNGERFEFIADAISAGIIGERVGPGRYWQPDPDEWLRIPGERLRESDRGFELRFVNALEEIAYLDKVRLIAADHPAEFEVHPNERMAGDPSNRLPARFYVVERLRPVQAAVDHRGRDAAAALERADRSSADGFRALPFKGFAEDWALTLDLGDRPADVLLLHGWTSWHSPASALAALQAKVAPFGPILDVEDRDGRWRLAAPDLGVPAGLPRTMLCDLRGLLQEGERKLRIRSNRTVYFDQALAANVVEDVAPASELSSPHLRLTELPLRSAELRWLGYPERRLPDGKPPATFDYHRVAPASSWGRFRGFFTRRGDVAPLLAAADDRFVVLPHGEEVALAFDGDALPEPPPGWRRTFLVLVDGFEKGMDVHGAFPLAVEPLPFRAMPSYPYPEGAYPADEFHLEYVFTWNTRHVSE